MRAGLCYEVNQPRTAKSRITDSSSGRSRLFFEIYDTATGAVGQRGYFDLKVTGSTGCATETAGCAASGAGYDAQFCAIAFARARAISLPLCKIFQAHASAREHSIDLFPSPNPVLCIEEVISSLGPAVNPLGLSSLFPFRRAVCA